MYMVFDVCGMTIVQLPAGHADSLYMCMSMSDNRTESAGASDNRGIKVFTINNKVSTITQEWQAAFRIFLIHKLYGSNISPLAIIISLLLLQSKCLR